MFNIFTLAFFAIFLGIALAVFATRQKLPKDTVLVPPEEDAQKDPPSLILNLNHLYQLGEKMLEQNQLKIKDKLNLKPHETYWIAESTNPFFYGNYVLAFFETSPKQPYVSLSNLFEFKDFLKSVGSTKGLFFTNGYFTRDVHQPLEGPKVSLYNRKKSIEELEKLGIKL